MLSREDVIRQSSRFGHTTDYDESLPAESADGEPLGVATVHVTDIVGHINVNEAQIAEWGIDPADYPGLNVLDARGRRVFPPPPSYWAYDRTIKEKK